MQTSRKIFNSMINNFNFVLNKLCSKNAITKNNALFYKFKTLNLYV